MMAEGGFALRARLPGRGRRRRRAAALRSGLALRPAQGAGHQGRRGLERARSCTSALNDWGKDFEAAALAQKLASRRTPIEEADGLIDAFARGKGPEKAERLTRVFAGVLDLINTERDRILHGIERYARGQRQLADRIRDEGDQISAVKDSPTATRNERASRTRKPVRLGQAHLRGAQPVARPIVCETPRSPRAARLRDRTPHPGASRRGCDQPSRCKIMGSNRCVAFC